MKVVVRRNGTKKSFIISATNKDECELPSTANTESFNKNTSRNLFQKSTPNSLSHQKIYQYVMLNAKIRQVKLFQVLFFLHPKSYFNFEFHPVHGWLFGAARNLYCLELALCIINAKTQKQMGRRWKTSSYFHAIQQWAQHH